VVIAYGSVTAWATETIIYCANTTQVTGAGWDVDFQAGYSCGRCVPKAGTFDAFAPRTCDGIQISPGAAYCDWT
jgi:hypothetical protein